MHFRWKRTRKASEKVTAGSKEKYWWLSTGDSSRGREKGSGSRYDPEPGERAEEPDARKWRI